ncbi:hypothetical protein L1887_19872 [Cichorium endivia]|nr:hypothetical protein L1887_19872 [Cichorium endivia]
MNFFRLNDSKVLALVYCKVQQLKQTLLKTDKNYAAQSQKDTFDNVELLPLMEDGVPKEGLRIEDVLVRIEVLLLVRDKEKQYSLLHEWSGEAIQPFADLKYVLLFS